jgi:hypothetical protein
VSPLEQEQLRARRFGFAALTGWASAGLCLEAAHAFKLSAYLDHPLRRELLVWGHAHGVGLALIVLAYAALGSAGESALRHGPRLRLAALLLPLGFVLSIFGQSESDPGPAIWLVPAAALLLLSALIGITRALRA